MGTAERSIRIFRLRNGRIPFASWFARLRDERAKQKILSRLARMRADNEGDTRSIGGRLAEIRISYGPGYRVYFGRWDHGVVILLCGGDKGSQRDDIKKARNYWKEFQETKDYADY